MAKFSILICSILLFFSYSNAQSTYGCTFANAQTGDQYNFTGLLNSQTDYTLQTTGGKVWINVCRNIISTLCGSNNIAACQQWDPNTPAGKATLGLTTTAQFVPLVRSTTQGQKGATLRFANGTGGRAFELDFQCDPKASIGSPTFELETPKLFYNFAWTTSFACPTNAPPPGTGGGLSGGGIFLILVFCLFAVYVAAGITYNVVRKKATGKEIIPNIEFWSSLPGLVKDGVMFIVNSTCRRGGYAQVH